MKGGKYATITSSGIDKTAMINDQSIHNFIETYEKGNKVCTSYETFSSFKHLVLEYEKLRDVKIRKTELQCLLVDENAKLIDSEETNVLEPIYDNCLTLLFSDRGSKLIYMMLYENKELFPEPDIMKHLYKQIQTSSMSDEGIRVIFQNRSIRYVNDILHGLFFTYDVIDIFTFVTQNGYPERQIYEFLDLVYRVINEILELKEIDYSCNIIIYVSKIKKIMIDGRKKDPPAPYSIETDPMFERVSSINH